MRPCSYGVGSAKASGASIELHAQLASQRYAQGTNALKFFIGINAIGIYKAAFTIHFAVDAGDRAKISLGDIGRPSGNREHQCECETRDNSGNAHGCPLPFFL
jgi:hypothetical protein